MPGSLSTCRGSGTASVQQQEDRAARSLDTEPELKGQRSFPISCPRPALKVSQGQPTSQLVLLRGANANTGLKGTRARGNCMFSASTTGCYDFSVAQHSTHYVSKRSWSSMKGAQL